MLSFALAAPLVGCRACDERPSPADGAGGGPTMPTGMLVPASAPSAVVPDATDVGIGQLSVRRGVKGGSWIELQVAVPSDTGGRRAPERWQGDSRFVSLEAMMQLHEPFARSLPGFDLLLPRLYDPSALSRLSTELDAFGQHEAGPIVATASELAAFARDTAAKQQSLWVIGP